MVLAGLALGREWEQNRAAYARALAAYRQTPEFIALVGITQGVSSEPEIKQLLDVLSRAPLIPVVPVIGNSDTSQIVRPALVLGTFSPDADSLARIVLLAENLAAYRPFLDRIAVVDCDESQQLLRTAARPGVDMDQARAILASQAGRLERMNIADDVIENRADLPALRESVRQLHALYLHLATACLEKNHNNSLH